MLQFLSSLTLNDCAIFSALNLALAIRCEATLRSRWLRLRVATKATMTTQARAARPPTVYSMMSVSSASVVVAVLVVFAIHDAPHVVWLSPAQ